MRFYLFTEDGAGLPILGRLDIEGYEVVTNIPLMWDGIVEKSKKIRSDDYVLFDMVGHGGKAQKLLNKKIKVFGGHPMADKMELDRLYGLNLMRKIGLEIPPTYYFEENQINKALDFLKSERDEYVLKPLANTAFTIVDDVIERLENYEGDFLRKGFILQKKIKGKDISTEAWYLNGKLIPNSYTHTLEKKGFMDKDLGPQIGCAISLVWKANKFDWMDKLQEVLPEDFSCPVDLNCIVDDSGKWWALEWTPRFGYNAIFGFLTLLQTSLAELLNGMPPILSNGFSAIIRVSMPPYPLEFDDKEEKEFIEKLYRKNKGISIKFPRERLCRNYWLQDIYYENDQFKVAGNRGNIGEVSSGIRPTVYEACRNALHWCEELDLPDKQYRTDLYERFSEDINYFSEVLDFDLFNAIKQHTPSIMEVIYENKEIKSED